MPSTSEVGYAKNVANLEILISFCKGYGGKYNPTKTTLQITELENLHATAKKTLAIVTDTTVTFNNQVNERIELFKPLKKLSTRLVNALANSDASTELIDDAKTTNRKIQGQRAIPKRTIIIKPNNPTPAPTNISTSQQSYVQMVEHYTKLKSILQSEPTYSPNEIELQAVSLENLIITLSKANTKVADAYSDVSNARLNRNKTLYGTKSGLYDTVQDVKKYVKSVFDATSPEFKQISKLRFKKPLTKTKL